MLPTAQESLWEAAGRDSMLFWADDYVNIDKAIVRGRTLPARPHQLRTQSSFATSLSSSAPSDQTRKVPLCIRRLQQGAKVGSWQVKMGPLSSTVNLTDFAVFLSLSLTSRVQVSGNVGTS